MVVRRVLVAGFFGLVVRLVVAGLVLPVLGFGGVERALFCALGPVLLWLDDEESPPEGSA